MSKFEISGQLAYDGNRPMRLDLFLASHLPDLSRTRIQHSIEKGRVLVNRLPEKSKYKLKRSDVVDYLIVDDEMDISDIMPEEIPLEILFENDDVIVICKQSGLTSHPTPNQKTRTLVNALLGYYGRITDAVYDPESSKSRVRAGIVHRLDKNTTGVMIIAKTSFALRTLSRQIKDRQVTKKYLALCYGWPPQGKGELTNYLGRDSLNRKLFTEVGKEKGKKAVLKYQVLDSYLDGQNRNYSLVEFTLITGRTHQIRAQSRLLGFPIIGDPLYFSQASRQASVELAAPRQLLHSTSLSIILPHQTEASTFSSPIPPDFSAILSKLTKSC